MTQFSWMHQTKCFAFHATDKNSKTNDMSDILEHVERLSQSIRRQHDRDVFDDPYVRLIETCFRRHPSSRATAMQWGDVRVCRGDGHHGPRVCLNTIGTTPAPPGHHTISLFIQNVVPIEGHVRDPSEFFGFGSVSMYLELPDGARLTTHDAKMAETALLQNLEQVEEEDKGASRLRYPGTVANIHTLGVSSRPEYAVLNGRVYPGRDPDYEDVDGTRALPESALL